MSKKIEKKDQSAELNGKVQTTGQESATNDSMDVKVNGSTTDTEIHEFDEPKSAINTRKAAEAVANGRDSGVNGVLTRGAVLFSGGAGGDVRDDMSATSKEGASYKSGDRSGRRADPITRKVDYIDAESIVTKRYQSKPLSETSEKQGYNGNYFNEHVLSQRASGGSPIDPIYERSVDEISLDMLYYPKGQFNSGKDMKLSIRNWDPSKNNGNGGYDSPTTYTLGNYLHRTLSVTFGSDGRIKSFIFDKANLTSGKLDEPTYRLAGDAFLRFINQSELDRNAMISVAGNESDPSWSCLGDGIVDASDQNRMISMLDTMTDFVALSQRKLGTALSKQINKVSKDGARVTGPMAEMVNGCIPLAGYGADASVSETNGRDYCFSKTAYHAGGAGLYLAISDSLAKYTTKGKLLSLPLSFKNAYSIAKSNADPLRVDDLLIKELKANELFSTIDGPYDPLKPVVVTDKAGLVYPIPLDLGIEQNITGGQLASDGTIYILHYENLRNKYNIRIRNFFTAGIFKWIADRGSRFYEALRSNSSDTSDHTVVIPIVSSTNSISLWDLIVCSATPYIIEERLTAQTELLKYEKNHGYPYTGSSAIKDVDVMAADNFSFVDTDQALVSNVAKPVAAMKVLMPEVFWPKLKFKCEKYDDGSIEGVGALTILPHYFVQNQFKYDAAASDTLDRKLLLSDDGATMAYPSFRSGTMLSYADTIYGMSEEDYRLSLDRMVVYPAYEGTNTTIPTKFCRHQDFNTNGERNSAYTYKYGLVSDGIPMLPYFAYASSSANKQYTLTVKDILSTPRELGLFQVAPAGVLSPVRSGASTLNLVSVDSSYLGLSGPGFRAVVYHAIGTTQENAILQQGSTNIDNNASLKYIYDTIYATPYDATHTSNGLDLFSQTSKTNYTPFVYGSYEPTESTFDFATGTYSTSETDVLVDHEHLDKDEFVLYSDHRYVWCRLQRLPFVVNPFDCNVDDLTSVASSSNYCKAINNDDIFDFMHYFGFTDFRASDYSQLVFARNKERIAKGMNYVTDPFVDKSLLLK